MTTTYLLIFSWVAAFLLGAIPTAYCAGRIAKGFDIRQHGSGNVGATNAFRVLGKKIGAVVFSIDFLKGFLPALCSSSMQLWNHLDPKEVGLWIGTGAILGHVFTPFLGFKGGKGIATGAGVLCAVFPLLFLIVLAVWLLVFTLTRVVSISSLVALITLVIASILLGLKSSVVIFFIFILLFIIWTHRSNISRLIEGKEKRVS